MYEKDFPFQLLFFFMYGVMFGGIAKNILYSILFIIVYEFYVFNSTRFFPPNVREVDRVLLNIVYIGGWIIGRCLMLNETGLECIWDDYLRFDRPGDKIFIDDL